ncbi:hypothetical protein LUX33_07940 [Actinomadura madurae]|uniref:PGPGW domain-containing protein n=1 Tax=Actinomadura madurae TaxID=1993 RepID=UPI0020D1FD2A|nr:PGPGW domain-containing protein [Actinomadura madurae]MCP9948352.1 hypothetical protein [Actinomadura madurae]
MMVTPGPGLLGIVIGLAILATEFAWAQRALHRAKTAADRAKEKALDPRTRRRNTILGALGAVPGRRRPDRLPGHLRPDPPLEHRRPHLLDLTPHQTDAHPLPNMR